MSRAKGAAQMNNSTKATFAVATALISAIALAFGLSWVELNNEVSLYSISIWAIIPVGAIGCGLVAASGYFASCRVLHLRPTPAMIVLPVATAIGTFITTNYFSYSQLDIGNGQSFSSFVSFGEYLRLVTTESGYTVGSAEINRVGIFGYVITALQILGFAAGGVVVQRALLNLTWCEYSDRYMKKTETTAVPFRDANDYDSVVGPACDLVAAGNISEARGLYEQRKALGKMKKPTFRSTAKFYRCTDCNLEHAVISGEMLTEGKWKQTGATETNPSAAHVRAPEPVLTS